jgi:glycine C-acetyltransferase
MSTDDFRKGLFFELDGMAQCGLLRDEVVINTGQGARIGSAGRIGVDTELINLCSNNYLGLANHPAVVEAARQALARYGLGFASVRFICGTSDLHKELEHAVAALVGMQDAILYSSCFDANTGFFETLFGAEDAIISDRLNHASIIDGIRLCKAKRMTFANGDMSALEECLRTSAEARTRLIVTDGVFSMDGVIADLKSICDLADRYDAMVFVDDSHGLGVIGPTGRGTIELHGVQGRVDFLSGTFGKALSGGSGGFIAASEPAVRMLRQKSRPYLFSNTMAPPTVAAALKAIELLDSETWRLSDLRNVSQQFRARMTGAGFELTGADHPIIPVMLNDASLASRMGALLVNEGVLAIGFWHPVVPHGTARIRTQLSALHSDADVDLAVDAFVRCRDAAQRGMSAA